MTNYKKPFFLGNGHFDTLFPYFFRKKKKQTFSRERLTLSDGDFLDLDWIKQDSQKLVVLSHGLESCSDTQYILGMADHLKRNGFDILAWNCRGCSGEINRAKHYYHSGFTQDLKAVVDHSLKSDYQEVYLIGFSMGGNLTLKYLGEEGTELDSRIKRACVFSTPMHLSDATKSLEKGVSIFYTKNFLKTLRPKVLAKSHQFPELKIKVENLKLVKNLKDFDEFFTAPMFNFKDAEDYYSASSSLGYLKNISIPSLIVNAKNDPFLSGRCYPFAEIKQNPMLEFETPLHGGHCGFFQFSKNNVMWSEERAFEFLTTNNEV